MPSRAATGQQWWGGSGSGVIGMGWRRGKGMGGRGLAGARRPTRW